MKEYRLSQKMSSTEYLALILCALLFICVVGALVIVSAGLGRAIHNYTVMSNAITLYPSEANSEMLALTRQDLIAHLIISSLMFLCFILPCSIMDIYLVYFHIATLTKSRIRITSEKIAWIFPGGELSTLWENVSGIAREKRIIPSLADPTVLRLREPVRPDGTSLTRILYRKPLQKIPISLFLDSWDSELGKEILRHTQWIAKE